MKEFESFIYSKEVKKASPDRALAQSLISDTKVRLQEIAPLNVKDSPKIIFENIYDSLRDLCDAILALEGYKSYSHEASISFLLKKGFDIATVSELDKFRHKRNSSKYYGVKIMPEESKQISDFFKKNKEKLLKVLKEFGLT